MGEELDWRFGISERGDFIDRRVVGLKVSVGFFGDVEVELIWDMKVMF